MNTPPRLHCSISIQQTSPKPTSSRDVIVFTPEAIRQLPIRYLIEGDKTESPQLIFIYQRKEEIRKEHEARLKRTKAKQIKNRFHGVKRKRNTTKGKK